MTISSIELRIEGPMAHITLNRPDKLNAINGEMVGELHRALDEAEASSDERVITLRGAGRAFCSGFDLGELPAQVSGAEMRRILEADFELILRFWNSPRPTIAAVHGYALGGGFELAMAPLDESSAERLLSELRLAKVLDGVRGAAPCDRAALVRTFVRLGALAHDLGTQIAEMDLNPVLVSAAGATAVDCLIIPRGARSRSP